MNWLAKINLNVVVHRLGVFRSSLLLVLLIITCVFCGYRLGNFFHGYQIQAITEYKNRLEILYQQQVDQVKRLNTLEVELEVERLANQRSLNLLKNMETEHYQVKKELAFYEKIMAPEKQVDGVVIDDVSITPTTSSSHYRFQVALVQQLLRKRFVKGYIEISLTGSLENKPSTIKLSNISSLTKNDLSFSFQYFQIIEGEFTLPENFIPEQINVSTVLPKNKWQKYHRLEESYSWAKIIQIQSRSLALILD
ncbi:MAG: hypothetical protein ACI9LM_001267 [Alteromonadaceae bacterium]|jgi:hypothetical protein